MQFDASDPADSNVKVDSTVERAEWVAVDPNAKAPTALQVVDGVRRAEVHAMDDGQDGTPLFALFGSFGVGTVRCEENVATIPEKHLRVERRCLQTGGAPTDREVTAGTTTMTFKAETPANATTANALVDALNRAMLDEETKLAEELSRDESTLTLLDGPLRDLRASGKRIVGYVKRIHNWYIDGQRLQLLPQLATGQRTPIVRLTGNDGRERYSWFLRLSDLQDHYHPLSSLMRLEALGTLPLHEAVTIADQSSVALPQLASSPIRDPRAPQNLTPVGGLERELRRRLGDPLWIQRLLASAISRDPL